MDVKGDLRLGAFVLPVEDLDRAIAFYTDVLGLRLIVRPEGITIAALESKVGQLWLLDYGGRLQPGHPTQLILFVDEGVDEWFEAVTSAGCEIRQEVHDDQLGRLFIFVDSEGNLVEIRQPADVVKS
jgi:predicted enzyme related to lactoylglutathione lyase